LREALKAAASAHRRFGYRRLHLAVAREGWSVNHKAVYRIYREEQLQVRRRRRRKVIIERRPLPVATEPNQGWSMDFIWDRTTKGLQLKFLVVMDDCTKELLAFEPALSSGSSEVIRILGDLILWHGKPRAIRSDNGSEFTSTAFLSWIHGQGIDHFLIQPGKPQQNGMVESLNGKIRDEFLNENWFHSVADARFQAHNFQRYYNQERPHTTLNGLTPMEFKEKLMSTVSCQVV
jgi:putative transposase